MGEGRGTPSGKRESQGGETVAAREDLFADVVDGGREVCCFEPVAVFEGFVFNGRD